jgi:hypothetical protein
MKNPPELSPLYPAINGSKDWIRDEVLNFAAKQIGPQFSKAEMELGGAPVRQWTVDGLISDSRTQAEISGGRPPSYMVSIKKSDGTSQILDKRVAFDPSSQIAEHEAKLDQRRQAVDFLRTGGGTFGTFDPSAGPTPAPPAAPDTRRSEVTGYYRLMGFIELPNDQPDFGLRSEQGGPPAAAPSGSSIDVFEAAFRQTNTFVSAMQYMRNSGHFAPQPDYNPVADLKGWKDPKYLLDHGEKFVGSQSPAETRSIAGQIDDEDTDKRLLAANGKTGRDRYRPSPACSTRSCFFPGGVGIDLDRAAA